MCQQHKLWFAENRYLSQTQWTLHQPHKIKVYFNSITNDIQIKICSNVIEFVSYSKNLGVIFNSKLTWSNHIASAIDKIYGMLRSLWPVKCSTRFGIRMLLAKTYSIDTSPFIWMRNLCEFRCKWFTEIESFL